METIGDHLRKVRLDRKLSQEALANQLGIPQVSINFWERNIRYPEMVNVKKIIAFLDYYPFNEGVTLPEKLLKYRRVNGLTQRELAAILDVSDTTVKSWEDGKYTPVKETEQKINDLINQKELST